MADSKHNAPVGCPTAEELEAHAGGAAVEDISRHVDSCPRCSEMVREIRNNDSFLLGHRDSLLDYLGGQPPRVDASIPTVPGYTILGEVARGGQGIILRAVQDATKRKVAIKMSLAGAFATAREKHRLTREIEIVASLRHPNIVTLFDSGTTPDGRDFVAMEYIHGLPLDRFARDRYASKSRPERDRVRDLVVLFIKVAKAVQHAHGRGVIHRDLKPGNILVDDAGEPHILDFGLARPLIRGQGATRTVTNEFLGTPAYASPEQVRGDPERIDARSDVYALGVMLYVAITGEPPYPVNGPLPDVLHHVTSTEPTRPSRVCPGLPGDVATILLHTLAKDPDRRYQSAGQLANDLDDYLHDRPISARRDSAWYVLRKTAGRHQAALIGAIAVLVALVIGIVGFAWQARRASVQRDAAIAAQRTAVKESQRAEATSRFLQNLLEYSDPNQGGKQDIKVSEAMLKGIQELNSGAFRDQPETEASLRLTIARILFGNGKSADALPLAQAALDIYKRVHEADHPDTAAAQSAVAGMLHDIGRTSEAESHYRQALAMRERLFPGDNADVAQGIYDLAGVIEGSNPAEAEKMFREALAMRRRLFPGGDPVTADSLNNLAMSFWQERTAEAEQYYREALGIRRRLTPGDNPDTANVLNNLGRCLEKQNRAAESEPLFHEALLMFQRSYPMGHPSTANCQANYAHCLAELGRLPEAREMAEQAMTLAQRVCPEGHAYRIKCQTVLAAIKQTSDDRAAAPR